MSFYLIDLENWERRDCFNHFFTIAKSTYSLTVNMDITNLIGFIRERNYRLYPTFTWIVSRAINNHIQFRMGLNINKSLGYYDTVSPDYAVLNERTQIMDSLCTPYKEEFLVFYKHMVSDIENYKTKEIHTQKCSNSFIVSCLPWLNYTSFTATNESQYPFLFPMVTWGKYRESEGKILMPLTLQIHHAVADGYHCSLFYDDIEQIIMNPEMYMK